MECVLVILISYLLFVVLLLFIYNRVLVFMRINFIVVVVALFTASWHLHDYHIAIDAGPYFV